MNNTNLKTLKELIDTFNTKYYTEKIDELEKQVDKMSADSPHYETEIKHLKDKIEDNKKIRAELEHSLSILRDISFRLESLAKEDILLDVFYGLLRENGNLDLENNKIHEKNNVMYKKLYYASIKPIEASLKKTSKETYKTLKAKWKMHAYKGRTIEDAVESNRIRIDANLGREVFKDFQDNYRGYPYSVRISELGVDIGVLDNARKQIKGEPNLESLTSDGKEAFNVLKDIEYAKKANININGRESRLIDVEQKYKEIVNLSRENWYLKEILKAFANTDIVDSKMYIGLQEISQEQELQLSKLLKKADKEYEKTGLQNKINLVEYLEDLYAKIEDLSLKIEQSKRMGNEKQTELLKQEYYNLRYEMIKILKDNPDLNNPKYNVDIEKIIKNEKEMLEAEIKKDKEIFVEKTIPEVQVTTEPTVKSTNNIEEKPKTILSETERTLREGTYIKESGKLESFELDSNLQTLRTYHYQNYMREKVMNSDLGKLSFSTYLTRVAPNLTELINIEKERESLARTIYKDYLKYYSSLENKKSAITFYEFASNNYGISNMDVPIEYDEEYKGMMR